MNKIWEQLRERWQGKHRRKPMQSSRKALAEATQLVLDSAEYLQQHPDVRQSGASALEHFLSHGHLEGRMPGDPSLPSFLQRTRAAMTSLPANLLNHEQN